MKNKKKEKVVYVDDGETIYSMAALDGLTPEQAEEREQQRKKRVQVSRKERRAMIGAAYKVYGLVLLVFIVAFGAAAVILYLLMK